MRLGVVSLAEAQNFPPVGAKAGCYAETVTSVDTERLMRSMMMLDPMVGIVKDSLNSREALVTSVQGFRDAARFRAVRSSVSLPESLTLGRPYLESNTSRRLSASHNYHR